MFSVAGTNNSRSEIQNWNYRINRLNDEIAERRFRRDERFNGSEGLSPQRVNSGSRNLGYDDDEKRELSNRREFSNRRDFRMSDDMVQRYQRNRDAGNREHFVKVSRMYQIPDNEDRRDGRNLEGKGYRETEFRKEKRDCRHRYQEMDETGHRETKLGKDRSTDLTYYQEIEELGYRDSEFRDERRDKYNNFKEINEIGNGETEFYDNKAIDRNRKTYPETNEAAYGETEFYDNKAIDRNRRIYPEKNETGYRETKFCKERRDKYSDFQEMNETGYGVTEFFDNLAIDRNRKTYSKMNETGCRRTEFCNERRDKYNYHQEMIETGHGETEFYDNKGIDRNRRTYPETNETAYGETEFYDNKAIDRNRKRYPKMNETGCKGTEFRDERRDKYNWQQEMNETGYRETEFPKERRDKYNYFQKMNETAYEKTEFYDYKAIDRNRNTYPETNETGNRKTDFSLERRDKYNEFQEMNDTGYVETESHDNKAIDRSGRAYPEKNEMGYMDRGLPHPEITLCYQEPNAQYIDRGNEIQQSNMQCQSNSSTWNTQVPLTVQYPPVEEAEDQEENEEKKPRKVWWYTTSRVFSVLLIISSLVSDWLQYWDMSDPIDDAKAEMKNQFTKDVCIKNNKANEAAAEKFLYFTIAGTVLAALQLANIIYQIVQNHRLPPDTDIRDWLDERTEVFLVNAFVKLPQTFLIHRHEESICFKCGTEISPKKIKGLLNGLSSFASSVWRYLTHFKVSTGTSGSCCGSFSWSNMCERCAARFGNCIKSCLLDCIKCLCPCCCCCIDCKTFIPCCCMYVICKNSRMSTKCVCQVL